MNNIHFTSSQYVMIEFDLATTIQRLLATMIDMTLFVVYLILGVFFWEESYSYINTELYEISFVMALVLARLPWLFYQPVCEFFFDGQTIGKYIMGIKVVTFQGERLSLKEIFIRWVFKGDFLWIGNSPLWFLTWFAIGFLAIFTISWSKYQQRLADRLANTLVIQAKKHTKYRLNDILKIKNIQNHTVTYLNVTRFSNEDMQIVKSVILRKQNYPNKNNKQLYNELSIKIAELINVDPNTISKETFLKQILQDYVVLTR